MTQRKDKEPRSSSVFNQNDPWAPTVDFAKFINNETIAGEVSWSWEMRVGSWDIPMSLTSLGWAVGTVEDR